MIPKIEHLKTLLDSAEGKEFAKYLASLILSLDSLQGLEKLSDDREVAIQVSGKLWAKKKLEEALSTLLTAENYGIVIDERDDYSMNVDDIKKPK